jgi:peptide/nickel transport system permease protein
VRNALIPVVTAIGLMLGRLLGGAVVTETIFAIPGIGRTIVDAIFSRDFPIVQGTILMRALVVWTLYLLGQDPLRIEHARQDVARGITAIMLAR